MTNLSTARSAYRTNSAMTASKEKVVVMLAERMVSDISQAIMAIEEKSPARAHELFSHAQDIVDALADSLDVETCPAGEELMAIYEYIRSEVVAANLVKDTERAWNAHRTAAAVSDMFREAERQA